MGNTGKPEGSADNAPGKGFPAEFNGLVPFQLIEPKHKPNLRGLTQRELSRGLGWNRWNGTGLSGRGRERGFWQRFFTERNEKGPGALEAL